MIKLKNISKIYQPSKDVQVVALADISIEIEQGAHLAVLGTSGSGKSTLMYIIGLLERPTKGEVYFRNQRTSKLEDYETSKLRNKTIGFVFQQFNLIPKLTVLENILLPRAYSIRGQTKESTEYAYYLLEQFKIIDKIKSFPNQLSGGQQQRVAIARALINKPDVIIADEPTGNLDTKTGNQIMELIQSIHRKEKKTIIVVTHEQKIAQTAEKILYIEDGRLIDQ